MLAYQGSHYDYLKKIVVLTANSGTELEKGFALLAILEAMAAVQVKKAFVFPLYFKVIFSYLNQMLFHSHKRVFATVLKRTWFT
jgi:hypothetical protein